MTQNSTTDGQRIIPYLYYENGPAALEYLCRAYGFEERFRVAMPDGVIMHAEVGYQGHTVMLGTPVDEDGKPQKCLRDLPRRPSSVMCYVDDVDAHYAHAKNSGAEIIAELEDKPYGDRLYATADPEGHHWYFATRVRNASDAET
ncbi:MAG TPA: VOC family protein [Nitrospiraceae bacterium]|nr:VOC family protein [Nitrospiraceae bacterium]